MFQMWQEVRPIMGSIRTPKPHYFNNGVIEFYVKNKQIYYQVKLWLKDGLTQFLFKEGKFENITVNQLVDDVQVSILASHSFSNVVVIEN